MLVSEMIAELQRLQECYGDVEVLISDGFDCKFYRGAYEITMFNDDQVYIDIGIGGCREGESE